MPDQGTVAGCADTSSASGRGARCRRIFAVGTTDRVPVWLVVSLRPGYGIRLEAAEELLAGSSPVGSVEAQWPAGRLRVSAYLGAAELPGEIPHRVRCLVTRGTEVLVIWDVFGVADCFPGGGAEGEETVAETASREVLEETGWHIDPNTIKVLGWMHVRSYVDPSADHPFPHPDGFMTVVHANRCGRSADRRNGKTLRDSSLSAGSCR